MNDLKLLIVSGLSGSGKSHALKYLEDIGFFCVDNLPPALLPVFIDLCLQSNGRIKKVAVGIDIREGSFLDDFWSEADRIRNRGIDYELVFFEARNEILIRRFSETRRPHPLAKDRPVGEGIKLETSQLAELKNRADRIIDTSEYTIHQLKSVLFQIYLDPGKPGHPKIAIVSFGYKYGVPPESDLLFDVRFLDNPHFVSMLRPLSGMDAKVSKYVFKDHQAEKFIKQIKSVIRFLFPYYDKEGRPFMTVSVGCTGGRHRSVAMACRLKKELKVDKIQAIIRHRDIDRDPA